MSGDAYRLERPNVLTALHALRRGVGTERAGVVWSEVGGPSSQADASPRELLAVANRIAERDGLEAIVGLALRIRCETWLSLYERTTETR